MNQASILYQLQNVDHQIDKIDRRLTEISSQLGETKEILTAQEVLSEKESIYEQKRKIVRHAEDEAQVVKIKLGTSESSLYGGKIKNPKELKDIQEEVAVLKRRINALEDIELDAMVSLEEAENDLKQAKIDLSKAEASKVSQNAGLLGEQSKLQQSKDKLLTEKNAVLPSVSPDELTMYQKLRLSKRGLAVAKLEELTCSACGFSLTPADGQDVKSPGHLSFCPSCGRILYAG